MAKMTKLLMEWDIGEVAREAKYHCINNGYYKALLGLFTLYKRFIFTLSKKKNAKKNVYGKRALNEL